MKMRANITAILLLVSLLAVVSSVVGKKDKNKNDHNNNNIGGLQPNFYGKCQKEVEKTVQDIVWKKVKRDQTMAAKLLRLHYHDCFVRVRIIFVLFFLFSL